MKEQERALDQSHIAALLLLAVAVGLGRASWGWAIATFVGGMLLVSGIVMGWWGALWEQSAPLRARLLARFKQARVKEESSPLRVYDVVIGKTRDDGRPVVLNLERMKSIAVWAETGGGKTSFIHNFIHDLITTHAPADLNLYIIDLKEGLDFRIWRRIPHLAVPIAENVEEASVLLAHVVEEMRRRGELFKSVPDSRMCNSLDDYHRINQELNLDLPRLPRLLIIADEVQDLATDLPEAVDLMAKVAKKGRAFGMSLLLSTQRPTVDAVPGKVQSQLNTKFIGKMTSRIDYSNVAQVSKDAYDGVTLRVGEFFMRTPGWPAWTIIKSRYVPVRELEKWAGLVAGGREAPEWPETSRTIKARTNAQRPWSGSNDRKATMVREWMIDFEEKPSIADFLAEFDASEATASRWINEVWAETERVS